jgi:hypothetical protein
MDAITVLLLLLWVYGVQIHRDARRMVEAKRKREASR